MFLIEQIINALVAAFLVELPSIIAMAHLIPALKRAGRPRSVLIVVGVAAALAPVFGIGVGFAADGAAEALGRSLSLTWLLAIGIIASSIAFTIALRVASGARSLLFAGLAATLVVAGLIGIVFALGGHSVTMMMLMVIFGLPFWQLTLGSWAYGWSHAERHRLIEINPTCLHCGYDMRGLSAHVCPECGKGPGG